jgi:transcriptional repressor NrdR
VDSRDLDETAIRRRRECAVCASRFTTYERIESARLTVVKRGGMREEFDRDKLASGLQKALTRRPVHPASALEAADGIEAQLRAQGVTEVPSSVIGEMAMERLRTLDQIAYVRFASVYQSFGDLEQLKREVDTLIAERADEAPGQTTMGLVAPVPKRSGGVVIEPAPVSGRTATARRSSRRS